MIDETPIHEYVKGKSLIIVGNGKETIRANKGSFIDSHDIVMRLNSGWVRQDYVQSMGKRTDIWLSRMYGHGGQIASWKAFGGVVKFHIRGGELSAIDPTLFALPRYQKITFHTPHSGEYYQHCSKIMGYGKTFHSQGKIKVEKPSTGAFAVYLFTHVFKPKSVSIVGFDFFSSPNPELLSRQNRQHVTEIEKRNIEKWLREYPQK